MCPFGAPLRQPPALNQHRLCAPSFRPVPPRSVRELRKSLNILGTTRPTPWTNPIARSSDSISDLTALQRILCPSFAYHQTKASELQVEIKYEPQSRGPHLGRRGFIILRIPE